MGRALRDDEQAALLLRVGLGTVWAYAGLVLNLLAPAPALLPLLAWAHLAPAPAAGWARGLGAAEVLLGLLLIRGRWLRPLAALQSALLLGTSLGVGISAPASLVDPAGGLAKNGVLCLAGLCLCLLPGRRAAPEESWGERAVPVLLRLGLAGLWAYEGLVLKWVVRSPANLEIVSRSGVVSAHIPRFLGLLGAAEVALALAVLVGLWVREVAALQVGLLTAFTLIVGWTSPAYLADPWGGLVKNVALIGCALALYRTGGGALAVDTWLARAPGSRRWGARAALQGCIVLSIVSAEVYRLQRAAAPTPGLGELFHALRLDEESQAEDLRSLLRRQGGRPLPVVTLARVVAGTLGCLTVILGTRAVLRFDLWLEERTCRQYGQALELLAAEEGLVGRALQAVEGRQVQHGKLLREQLEAVRRPPMKRRR